MQRKRVRGAVFLGMATLAIFSLTGVANIVNIHKASAQSSQPQFLMTWSASNSYAPALYAGKILPNQQSQIIASFEVIAGGKLVNISGQTVYWYLDGNLLDGGIGIQQLTFRPFGSAPTTMNLSVQLPDYPGGPLTHEINIPVVEPEAVIDAPYPQAQFSESPATLQAIPYFFAATSTTPLNFAWAVNGQAVSNAENPQVLQISLPQSTPSGYAINVALTVQSADGSTIATAAAALTYQKQP